MCRHADYSHYIVQQVLPLNKVLGQSTVLPFLGIKLDAATMTLQSSLRSWQGRKSCTKRAGWPLTACGQIVKPTFWDTWLTWQQRLKNFSTTFGSTRGFNPTSLVGNIPERMEWTQHAVHHHTRATKSIHHIWCIGTWGYAALGPPVGLHFHMGRSPRRNYFP